MLVCLSVWTGRGYPGCLVIISWLNYISLFLLCCFKKSKLTFLQLPPFFLFISCCGDKSPYFFRSTTCTHNQSYINQHFQFKYCTQDRNKGEILAKPNNISLGFHCSRLISLSLKWARPLCRKIMRFASGSPFPCPYIY